MANKNKVKAPEVELGFSFILPSDLILTKADSKKAESKQKMEDKIKLKQIDQYNKKQLLLFKQQLKSEEKKLKYLESFAKLAAKKKAQSDKMYMNFMSDLAKERRILLKKIK